MLDSLHESAQTSRTDGVPDSAPITTIGLGPMGRAMAGAFLDAGHPVTLWNRTPARADSLVARGAALAPSPADAVHASELIILSLTDYQAMYDILGDTAESLQGRTVVNLSSDTPQRAREAAAWAADHGAEFLTGGVMAPAPMIATEEAYVYYSGSSATFERVRDALSRIGAPRYLGEDPALAQLMYLAQLDVFLTSLSSLMHATALLGSAGISARDALPELLETLTTTPQMLGDEDLGAAIDAGTHPGHLSTALMMGATADHIVQASEAAQIDLSLPRAVHGHYQRVIEDGLGSDNWTRIVDGIRRPR